MKLLKTTRLRLGLKQHELAALLGMKRDHYAMAETGKRMITAHAAQQLSIFLPLVPAALAPEKPSSKISGEPAQELEHLLLKARQRQYVLKEKLKTLSAKNEQARHLRLFLQALKKKRGIVLSVKQQALVDVYKQRVAAPNTLYYRQQMAIVQAQLAAVEVELARFAALLAPGKK